MTSKSNVLQQQKGYRRAKIAAGICAWCAKINDSSNGQLCSPCKECNRLRAKICGRVYTQNNRRLAFDHYGHTCKCCGESEKRFLCFDHIDNNGNKHRKEFNISNLARWLKVNNYPEGFQVLCFNCNHAKHLGGCPHNSSKLLGI